MNQPRQFQLTPGEVLAIQRNGTPHRDLEIAEWMERSQPHSEYRATTGAFVVITPTVDLPAGTDHCDRRLRRRSLHALPGPGLHRNPYRRSRGTAAVPVLRGCDPVPQATVRWARRALARTPL